MAGRRNLPGAYDRLNGQMTGRVVRIVQCGGSYSTDHQEAVTCDTAGLTVTPRCAAAAVVPGRDLVVAGVVETAARVAPGTGLASCPLRSPRPPC